MPVANSRQEPSGPSVRSGREVPLFSQIPRFTCEAGHSAAATRHQRRPQPHLDDRLHGHHGGVPPRRSSVRSSRCSRPPTWRCPRPPTRTTSSRRRSCRSPTSASSSTVSASPRPGEVSRVQRPHRPPVRAPGAGAARVPRAAPDRPFEGDIVFQIDRRVSWQTIKTVARTCAAGGLRAPQLRGHQGQRQHHRRLIASSPSVASPAPLVRRKSSSASL
jgi:hypothetical protein